MDGEFPWLYVAMIVIAFVSWIFNRIQESTAARRRSKEIQEFQEDEDYEIEEEEFFEEPAQQPVSSPPANAEDAMRKLMEALGGTVANAPTPQPAPTQQIQKPLPKDPSATATPAVVKSQAPAPRLNAEERAALDRIRLRDRQAPVRKKRVQGNLASISISDLVHDPDGIRKAVILREILDRPRAERPWE